MSKVYIHRYKVQVGPLRDQIFNGVELGVTLYPGQIQAENLDSAQVAKLYTINREGIWLNEPQVRMERTLKHPIASEVGVDFGDYIDLCITFDRTGVEISVGDTVYMAVSNEVVLGVVEKIAKTPVMLGYGIWSRKVTVRPVDGGSARTINDSRSMVKAPV